MNLSLVWRAASWLIGRADPILRQGGSRREPHDIGWIRKRRRERGRAEQTAQRIVNVSSRRPFATTTSVLPS